MKTYFIVGVAMCAFGATCSAQSKLSGEPTSPKTIPLIGEEITNVNVHKDPYVIQSIGRTYNSRELLRLPVKDINAIANTVPGVQSRAGETPIIGGAENGTAYYVDGVRVYGALPTLMK